MTDSARKTTAEPDIIIDIRGDVSGQVAVGEHIYQHQTNVSDGGLAYVLEEGVVPFTKAERPVRLLSRADPPLLDREEEMEDALGAIRAGGIVQVTGGSGSGKSLFLTHLAHKTPAALEHGVVHLRGRGQSLGDLGFRLFYAFHKSLLPTAYIPPPPQIQEEMTGTTAAIVVDDVDGLANDIDGLLDMAVDCGFVLSSRTEVLDSGADVTLGGLPMPKAVELFARMHRGPIPDGPGVPELCAVLDGHPQCVVFAAKLVNTEGVDPAALAAELSGPDRCHEVAKRLLEALPESEAQVAAFLAAFGRAPVPVAQAMMATKVSGADEVLGELASAGIAPSNSPQHALNPLLQEAAEELWDLDELRVEAVDHLTGWLGNRSPEDPSVLESAPMVLHLMDWAAGTGRHDETVALGEGIDGALALSGLWGSWERVHQIVLGSARDAGDAAAQGWALHQMGTKALCWGERSAAESLLGEALDIRVHVGVQSAIDTTQHNLDVLNLPPGGGSGEDETPPGGGGGFIAAVANSLALGPIWPAAFLIGAVLAITLAIIPVEAWTKTLTFVPSTLSFRDVPVGGAGQQTTVLWNRSDKTISDIGLTIEGSGQFTFGSVAPVADSFGEGILASGSLDLTELAQPGTTTCMADEDRFLATLAPGQGCRITVVLTRTSSEVPDTTLFARKGENTWSALLSAGTSGTTTTTSGTTTTTNGTTTTTNGTTTTTNGTTTTTTPLSADLVVRYGVSHDKVGAGQNLTYTIIVRNNGPSRARNVRASAVLPGELALVSVTSSQGSCSTLPCTLGTVSSGSSATVRLEAAISAGALEGAVLTSSASVVSDVTDPRKTNNTASARTRVQAAVGVIDIDPETLEFGDMPGTEQQLSLTNVGVVDVTIGGHSVPDAFTAEGCVTTLAPDDSCVITVTFAGGASFGVLEVSHSGEGDRRVLITGGK